MATAIEISGLTKQFGKVTAVDCLSLTVPEGEICGLIGPNGAGKTTTLKILATMQRPDAGRALIFGRECYRERREVRRLIGYMPDDFGFQNEMTVTEYLTLFAAAYYIPPGRRAPVVSEVLELTDLLGKRDARPRSLSRGMQQRLCLARALLHDPKLLILDEPAAGLDPRARVEIREFLRMLGGMGKTIIISSHILAELADICTSVAVIEQGRLVAAGSVNDILAQIRPQVELVITTVADEERCCAQLREMGDIDDVRLDEETIIAVFNGEASRANTVVSRLVQAGIRVEEFSVATADLEDAFMALTEGNVQ